MKLYFIAPPEYQIGADITAILEQQKTAYEITDDFDRVIPEVDAIYMTRLQDEWDQEEGGHVDIDIDRYSFKERHLDLLKPDGIIMHPLPRRQEIAAEVDSDPRAAYWRQVRNGMYIRVALIASIFHRDRNIREYYLSNNL